MLRIHDPLTLRKIYAYELFTAAVQNWKKCVLLQNCFADILFKLNLFLLKWVHAEKIVQKMCTTSLSMCCASFFLYKLLALNRTQLCLLQETCRSFFEH